MSEHPWPSVRELQATKTGSEFVATSGFHIGLPRQASVLISTFPTVIALSTPISAPSCLGAVCYNSCLIP